MRRLTTAALALLLLPATTAATPRDWYFAADSYLKRKPAERGAAANGQPLRVDPAVLAHTLESVSFLEGTEDTALLLPAEAQDIAKALAEALALAGPGEDLELMTTRKRDRGWFQVATAVTARLFAKDGRLNLIVHDTRLDFHVESILDGRLPTFLFGSRSTAGPAQLKAAHAQSLRADWLVLPLSTSAPEAQSVATPPPVATPPSVATPPPVATIPVPPPASVEERLRGLKRFRDQGLITQEDYDRQKQELLKAYTSGPDHAPEA